MQFKILFSPQISCSTGRGGTQVEFASTAGGTCTYYHDLFAVPFVATMNYSTKNLEFLRTNDFLSVPANRIVIEWPIVEVSA